MFGADVYLDRNGGCGVFEVNSAPGFDQVEDYDRVYPHDVYAEHYGVVVDLLN